MNFKIYTGFSLTLTVLLNNDLAYCSLSDCYFGGLSAH